MVNWYGEYLQIDCKFFVVFLTCNSVIFSKLCMVYELGLRIF